jgi:hypothetical protein
MARTKFLGFILGLLLWAAPAGAQSRVQAADGHGSATTVTATMTVTAGNLMVADVISSGMNPPLQVTDNFGDVFHPAPVAFIGTPPGVFTTFYCANVHGGATTVSATLVGGGSTAIDVYLTEISGLAQSSPVAMGTFGNANGGSTNTGSITVPSGTYYLYSIIGDSAGGSTYTGTSGFTQYAIAGSYFRASWGEVVSPSTTTTYTNTVTSSGTFSSSVTNLIAFSVTNETGPRVIQTSNNGDPLGNTSVSDPYTGSITAGNLLVVFASWGGSAPGTVPTDTLSNTWTTVETGNSFGLWTAIANASGSDTVYVNPSANASIQVMEIAGVTSIAQHASNSTTSGTSIATGNITTTNANDLILTFGASQGACNAVNITGWSSGWQFFNDTGSHCSTSMAFEQLVSSTGTFSNTFTAASSTNLAAAILSMPVAIPFTYSAQPVVNIIQ